MFKSQNNGFRNSVTAYSLGNITSSFSAPHIALSGILNVTIAKGQFEGKTKALVTDAKMIPVVQEDFISDGVPKLRIKKLETFLEEAQKGDKQQKSYAAKMNE